MVNYFTTLKRKSKSRVYPLQSDRSIIGTSLFNYDDKQEKSTFKENGKNEQRRRKEPKARQGWKRSKCVPSFFAPPLLFSLSSFFLLSFFSPLPPSYPRQ
jgi:hypothetical protein